MSSQPETPDESADRNADNPLLAFVHLPKTGGTSLQVVLEKHAVNGRPVFNVAHPAQAKAFLQMPGHEQSMYYGVFGHMPFGIDRYVKRPVNYITFLRDPVERMLSAYSHILRQLDHPLHAEVLRQGIAWTGRPCNLETTNLADHDFAEQPNASGRYWWGNIPPSQTLGETLAQAKANLERCAFIGLTETYDDDIRALPDLKGTPIHVPAAVPREQTGGNRLKQADLTEEQVERIRTSNSTDMELYAYALKLRAAWGGPLNPTFDMADPVRRAARRGRTPLPLPQTAKPANVWRPLRVALQDFVSRQPILSLPAECQTPQNAWDYGLGSDRLFADRPAAIRVGLRAVQGRIGLCLLDENYADVVSESHAVTPEDGEVNVVIEFPSDRAPVRLLVRNHDDAGNAGRAVINSIEIIERA